MRQSTSFCQHLVPWLASLFAAIAPCTAHAQPQPGSREAMWPAPTEEDWKKPCPIAWQRTWDDAVAVSRETGRPILVCVNMDGEIASEHYAGIRYRQPEITKLYEPYVTVIASVYRHTPRDHDERGERILCPRFGSVTCGEHIAIEPIIYENFLDGRRISPRHIMVELDGTETYDVFYALDTDSVFATIRDGIANRDATPRNIIRGDRPIVERVASRDNQDRTAVEAAYASGDKQLRGSLVDAALRNKDAAPVGLLRLAVFGFDPELSKKARTALAETDSPSAVDLIAESLRVPMDDSERKELIETLGRLGETSLKARTLSTAFVGLSSGSSIVDESGWTGALGAEYPAPTELTTAPNSPLGRQNEIYGGKDPDELVALADSFLLQAEGLDPTSREARVLYVDAKRTAEKARSLGAAGSRLAAIDALTAYRDGDFKRAWREAEEGVKAIPPDPQGENAMILLSLFAASRQQAIADAVRAKRDWPSNWITDVNRTYATLAEHPLGVDAHVANHYDFLKWFGAAGETRKILAEGLARFPDSPLLHDRLRGQALRERGITALETLYDDQIASAETPGNLHWFAGYAGMVAAEFHRRRNRFDDATTAYESAEAHFVKHAATDPTHRESADHYRAMSIAGRARIALEQGDLEGASRLVLASFETAPYAAASLDGLNISAVGTAQMLRQRLVEQDRGDLAKSIQDGLDGLPEEMLIPPAFEFENPEQRRNFRPRGARGGAPRDGSPAAGG